MIKKHLNFFILWKEFCFKSCYDWYTATIRLFQCFNCFRKCLIYFNYCHEHTSLVLKSLEKLQTVIYNSILCEWQNLNFTLLQKYSHIAAPFATITASNHFR